jgi:hypothetical protein
MKKAREIFCAKCGEPVKSKDGFCPKCGSHLFEIKRK